MEQIAGRVGTLILTTVSIIVSIVLLEFLVRISFPIYDPSGHVQFERLPDGTPIGPRAGIFRQIKNTGDFDVEVRFNDFGLRDEKSLAEANDKALFVVGDSMAFGWGVNARDRFSDRLQTSLNRPVFNIAIGGADLDGYHGLVRHAEANGVVVKDLVISVTMENDLHDYESRALRQSAQSPEKVALPPFNSSNFKAYLINKSALYVAVTNLVHQTTWLKTAAVQLGLITPNFEGIGTKKVSDGALVSSVLRLCQLATGRATVILIIPSRRLWIGESARRAEASRVHAAFVNSLSLAGMNVVDMREQFETGGRPLSYHFANDGHWNEEAHRMAAEVLTEMLLHRK